MKVRLPRVHRGVFGRYIKWPDGRLKVWLRHRSFRMASVTERCVPYYAVGRWR